MNSAARALPGLTSRLRPSVAAMPHVHAEQHDHQGELACIHHPHFITAGSSAIGKMPKMTETIRAEFEMRRKSRPRQHRSSVASRADSSGTVSGSLVINNQRRST